MRTDLDVPEVAQRLRARADALPVPAPSWEQLSERMRRIRRRRRHRRAGMAAGVLLSLAAVGVGVQAGTLPYPGWAPAVAAPGAGSASRLAGQPTRGSLAGDEAWLAAFREHVAGLREEDSGGESWQVGTAGDVTVIFAGDVAGHRLAAVEAPYRWGLIEAPQQVWFMGPVGAPPERMEKNANGSPADVMATEFGPGVGYGSAGGASGWLVLTPDAREVTLVQPPVYAADGSVTRERVTLPAPADGVYVYVQDADPGGITSVDAAGLEAQAWSSPWVDEPDVPDPQRGTPLPRQLVASALSTLYSEAGLSAGAAQPLVLWSGGPAGRPSAVLALRVPSGALVIGLGHRDEDPAWMTLDGTDVLAAQPVDQIALAWQQARTEWITTGDETRSGAVVGSDWVGLLGPATASSAEVLDGDGRVLARAPLEDGGGVAQAAGAVSVRFLDGAGVEVARAGVRPWTAPGQPLWDR